MKWLISTSVMMFICIVFGFSQQAQKTLIKSVEVEGSNLVAIALPGDVKVVKWDKNYVRVTTTIDLKNSTEDILKKLSEVGRYNVQTTTDASGKTTLLMPTIERKVTIKGVELMEQLSIEVAIPENMKYEVKPVVLHSASL